MNLLRGAMTQKLKEKKLGDDFGGPLRGGYKIQELFVIFTHLIG